jgi:hypothetical protein
LELETQGNLLETMMTDIESFKGGDLPLEEGTNHSRCFDFTVSCQDSTQEGRSSVSGNTSLRLMPEKRIET